jgi:hypothetical protein
MAKVNLGLRHGDVDTTQKEGGGLPDGFYRVEVDEMTVKDHHHKRKGYRLDVVLEVIEPEQFKGRKIFFDFGVDDPENPWNVEAEDWARQDFAKFLKAVDFPADKEFDDTDDVVGESAIVRYGLDRKRSDKQNKRYGKVWGYVYPEDERDWLADNELGASDRQEEWFPAKQTETRGGGRDRDRDSGRGGREERGGARGGRDRDDRGSRDDRGDRGDSRGGRDDRDSDRERSRDRDESRGRDRSESREERGNEDDDIPFDGRGESRDNDRGEDRPRRGNDGANPWNRKK